MGSSRRNKTGKQAALFAEKGAKVTGLDLSEAMLKKAREKKNKKYKGSLDFIYGNATKMPFKDNQFDISSISLALHEMNHYTRNKVLKEMIRVTKQNKSIILVDYTKAHRSFMNKFYGLCMKTIEKGIGGEHYKNYKDFMERGGLSYLVKKHNLDIVEEKSFYCGNISIFKFKK